MRHVDLCSGIGGFALGFEWAELSKPVLFCDIEPWSRKILAKHWPDVPIAEDVKELANDPERLVPKCDILTAGYPCQPFSVAGARRGTEDDRHIWPYILSIVQAKRCSWCVFENVYGHVSMGLDEVLSDLEREGYAARSFIVPACGVDAPHRRDRLWIIARNVGDTERSRQPGNDRWQSTQEPKNGCADVAHASRLHGNGSGEHTQQSKRQEPKLRNGGSSDDVAHADDTGSQGWVPRRQSEEWKGELGYAGRGSPTHRQPDENWWLPEPSVGRVANGIPRRVDRLRGLGNAIVPQIAQRIGQVIKQVEADE